MPMESDTKIDVDVVSGDNSTLFPPADPVAYDAWFRAKVQEALDGPRPSLSSEEVQKYFSEKRAAILEKIRKGTSD